LQFLKDWNRRLVRPLLERLFTSGVKALVRLSTLTRRDRSVRRSLWAGTPILTLPVKARAESMLGVQAETLVFRSYFITNAFDYNLEPWLRGPAVWAKLMRTWWFIWALIRFQRFHFFCDRGLLSPGAPLQFRELELKILRDLGKQVFFWTYGADVRTRERTLALGPYNCCTECPEPGSSCVCDEAAGHENYARLRRYATAIFSTGDMIEYTPGSRDDLYFWPLDLDRDEGRRYAPRYPNPDATGPIKICHAPNHRAFKGTRYLIDAVKKLQDEGMSLELRLVEKVPNHEALEIYRTADIVFDQCLIGFHGYFALEAMAMGKPVMVYIRDARRYLLHPDQCPLVNAPADRVLAVLRDLASNRRRLHDLGVQGRRYVEKHFTIDAFAERLRTAYQDLGVLPRGCESVTGQMLRRAG
jgi:glycosyltransferase involved in cell wall biosynthesis